MRNFKYIWAVGLALTSLIIIAPIVFFTSPDKEAVDDPWAAVPAETPHTDHTSLIEGPLTTGPEVTEACLTCHEEDGHEMLSNVHWTWTSPEVEVDWSDDPVSTGKANLVNNFCIGVQSNWSGCTKCHAGYGFDNESYFETADETSIDCLVCHDQSGGYAKATSGLPAEGVDLLAAAQSVGSPTRQNCGTCHFYGGGGDAVKHGDLDSSMTNPSAELDIHMGELDFQCITCHTTEDHQISGRSISVSVDDANQVACTDCHSPEPHPDERLNEHTDTVACQTCHIPTAAVQLPTKAQWDWSTAGNDWPEDPHEYLKIKGNFVYEQNYVPQYQWYNGVVDYRYLLGDPINPDGVTLINPPAGSIDDSTAKIWPFKIHDSNQPYDVVNGYLLQPKTVGEFWVNFDWQAAFELGSEAVGLPYSGEYSFTETYMWFPLTHMVAPATDALQCTECHGEDGRMDWTALGYPGDPIDWGGR